MMREKNNIFSEMRSIQEDFNVMSKERLGNIEYTIAEIDKQYQVETSLSKNEIGLIFPATALQIIRIWLINNLTEIEKAGNKNRKENKIHDAEKKVLSGFEKYATGQKETCTYYASLQQIITGRGVPYDATGYYGEKFGLLKGANHRFSTLGHDPVLGLIFGTANILTNTITCVNLPLITTNHVVYDGNLKNPRISSYASTAKMFEACSKRMKDEKEAVVAAMVKQVAHIGTDLYTPCGIQLPMANLVFDKSLVEKITKVISMGDVLKYGGSKGLSDLIDLLITVVHAYANPSKDMFEIKNRKIIDISNAIATGSNVLYSAIEGGVGLCTGNGKLCADAIKKLDVAGLVKITQKIVEDYKFAEELKREYFKEHWAAHLQGGK